VLISATSSRLAMRRVDRRSRGTRLVTSLANSSWTLAITGAIVSLLASCGGDPMLSVRQDFAAGRLELAHAAISELVDGDGENRHVWRLERSVTSLGLGRASAAIADLRAARDQFDDLKGRDYTGWFESVLLDDRSLTYQGADYEVVLIRALLGVAALMDGNSDDAGAYALQVAEKQQEIIESFQTNDGGRPKANYQLVAFGSYLRAILDEGRLQFDLAQRGYERVRELEPSFAPNAANIERATSGHIAAAGNGVVHVLALVGRGPYRIEVDEPVTRDAFAIAQLMWAFLRRRATIPNIAAVKIPALAFHRDNPSEVHAEVDGTAMGVTATVTDVESTARREFDALRSHQIARAVIRRAFKIVVTEGAKEAIRPRDREYRAENALVDLLISGAGIAWAAMEAADLRCWSLLPASFQVLRLELAAGEHDIVLRAGRGGLPTGAPQRVRVLVRDGYNTYITVLSPTASGGPQPLSSDPVVSPPAT